MCQSISCHYRTLFNPIYRLIYQLLDYERALRGGSPTDSFGPSEDEEWERRRRLLDQVPDHESTEVLKEAKALDEEMEERRARKASSGSLVSVGSNTNSFTGAVRNGAPWRSRFGHAGFALASQRTRAGSIGSTYTSRSSISVLSEDPVEEEEEEDDTFGSGKNVTTPSTDATDDDAHRGQIIVVRGELERPTFKLPPIPATPARLAKLKMDAASAGVPPSAPAIKRSFNLPAVPPSAPANKRTFKASPSDAVPPSASFHRQSFGNGEIAVQVPATGLKKERRRPPPLLGVPAAHLDIEIQVVPSRSPSQNSITLSSVSSVKSSDSLASSSALSVHSSTSTSSKAPRSSRRRSFKPPAILFPFPSTETPPAPASAVGATPLASQTLFVFPPSPKGKGGKTPSTLMLTTVQTPTYLTAGFGAQQGGLTPRALSFMRQRTDGRKSWVSGTAPVTPTIATARVDAKGCFGLLNP
jgi:tyrosine-protein phosphatase